MKPGSPGKQMRHHLALIRKRVQKAEKIIANMAIDTSELQSLWNELHVALIGIDKFLGNRKICAKKPSATKNLEMAREYSRRHRARKKAAGHKEDVNQHIVAALLADPELDARLRKFVSRKGLTREQIDRAKVRFSLGTDDGT